MSRSFDVDPMQSHVPFGRLLRSAPTTAIDHYRTLYASSKSSPSAARDFAAASQVLMAAHTYKDWETHVDAGHLVITRDSLEQECALGVDAVSADIWNAVVSTELPLFWLDCLAQRNPIQDPMSQLFLQCLLPFTHVWSLELQKAPSERRDGISTSFARLYFSKFSRLFSVLWQDKERLAKHFMVECLGRLAHDLLRIHTECKLPDSLLVVGKLAHATLFALVHRNRMLMTKMASPLDLEAFEKVSAVVRTARGEEAQASWLQDMVKAIGPEVVMDALGAVVFHSFQINVPLGSFAGVMRTMVFHVRGCLHVVFRDPVGHFQRCSRALERQLQGSSMAPVGPLRWANNVLVWESLYRLCLLPYDGLVGSRAQTREVARLLFDFQTKGVTITLEILAQKAAHVDTDPVTMAKATHMINERLREAQQLTTVSLAAVHDGVQDKWGNAQVFQEVYTEVGREGWSRTTKLLRNARPKYAREAFYGHLVQLWIDVGQHLGLSEATVLLQLDRTCSNPSCQYHLVPAAKPLSTCKGCQQARYCSRECQRSDWTEHKPQCRRLKEAAS